MPAPDDHEDLTQLADELLREAAELRRGWEALEAALDDVDPPQATPAREAPSQPEDEEDPRRLIALNMALGGRDREETAAYLRGQFGDDGVDDIVRAVYEG